jgi:hypothetical protein
MKRQYYRITGHDELRRDAESLGIVNVDAKALNKFKEEREFKRKLSQMITEHEEIKKLVAQYGENVSEMKTMLTLILSKMGN